MNIFECEIYFQLLYFIIRTMNFQKTIGKAVDGHGVEFSMVGAGPIPRSVSLPVIYYNINIHEDAALLHHRRDREGSVYTCQSREKLDPRSKH